MNKKAIGSILIALSLAFALIKNFAWVSVGLLVVAVVINCDEKAIKRVSQCLALLLSVLIVKQLIVLIFGGFVGAFNNSNNYYNFYNELIRWVGIVLDYYLIVFVVLGVIFFILDKELPLYGSLVNAIYDGCKKACKKDRDDKKQEDSKKQTSENASEENIETKKSE